MLNAFELEQMNTIAPFRNRRLFEDFLPTGYRQTTLSGVKNMKEVLNLKVILGTLITLYDDFADRPSQFNPGLLKLLYRIPFDGALRASTNLKFTSPKDEVGFGLAKKLYTKLYDGIKQLPQSGELITIFEFDLKQFFMANQYSELLTMKPELNNGYENKLYMHHNMGMVMSGMIDLMSMEEFDSKELGEVRRTLAMGQRAGRISNVVSTYAREISEGDSTSEIVKDNPEAVGQTLMAEHKAIVEEIKSQSNLRSINMLLYARGLEDLHDLHLNLQGVI